MRTIAIDWSFKSIKKLLPKEPGALLAFRLPAEMQERVDELLELNQSGSLDAEGAGELERVRQLELKLRGLKAKALDLMSGAK
ncbi:MAG TPA: hypothetical protein VKX17_25900 [Planctomycetota bacterium]|nr:hypothetical protein [Planctomycetota bacterium]